MGRSTFGFKLTILLLIIAALVWYDIIDIKFNIGKAKKIIQKSDTIKQYQEPPEYEKLPELEKDYSIDVMQKKYDWKLMSGQQRNINGIPFYFDGTFGNGTWIAFINGIKFRGKVNGAPLIIPINENRHFSVWVEQKQIGKFLYIKIKENNEIVQVQY